MTLATTPLLGHDDGDGWHLTPRRRHLFTATTILGGCLLAYLGWAALREGVVPVAVGAFVLAVPVAAVPFERQRPAPARVYESPTHFGLLLPVRPLKVSLIVVFAILGPLLLATPFGLVWAGTQGRLHGGEYVGAVLASVVTVGAGLLFLAGAWGGVVSRRSPHRGILLTVDGVVLRTQRPPVSFPWHAVREVRPHWRRQRIGGDLFPSPDDPIANWFTFVADPGLVDGPTPLQALAHTEHPTLDASKLALDPVLALEVCRFYLADAEARAELRTTAALDRVASLERALSAR